MLPEVRRNRILYIDAMRGLAMLLIVMLHVSVSLQGGSTVSWFNEVINLFSVPLFFFISGFLFYRFQDWTSLTMTNLIVKKTKALLIPTAFWGGLYVLLFDFSLYSAFIDHGKAGYWFTVALFIFYLVYMFSMILVRMAARKIKNAGSKLENVIVVAVSFVLVAVSFGNRVPSVMIHLPENLYQIICGPQLWFYLYFVFGALARKYLDDFQKLLDSWLLVVLVAFAILGYAVYLKYNLEVVIFAKAILRPVLGFLGVIITFAFFKRYSDSICSNKIGKAISFVGERTLDIYLLHYFFVPSGIPFLSVALKNNVMIDVICSFGVAVIVILLCLLVSKIIRTRPLLATLLFGAKPDVTSCGES